MTPADVVTALAALAGVSSPSSASSPGGLWLRAVEVATTDALDVIDRARAASDLGDLDDAEYDYHVHADLWPAVDAVLGDRSTEAAFTVAVDLSLWESEWETTEDALGYAAWNLVSALSSARWPA